MDSTQHTTSQMLAVAKRAKELGLDAPHFELFENLKSLAEIQAAEAQALDALCIALRRHIDAFALRAAYEQSVLERYAREFKHGDA